MKHTGRFASLCRTCLFLLLANQASGQTPPLFLSGAPGDRLSLGMANAGDVNGDGIDDLIVGADHYFGNKVGEARIYFGGNPPDATADVVLVGDPLLDYFGWSVSGVGDVNGDGYDDVLVSAYGSAAYLYFGGNPMDTTPDAIIPAVPSTTAFGVEVDGAGDVNGDGYDDFIVCGVSEGGIFLYFGSPTPGTTPDLTFAGASRAQAAGDMNHDGYDDIIVGNPKNPPDLSWAALHFGGAAMDTIPDLIYRTGLADGFGSSLAGNGDLNGDGWPDLVISAAADNSGGTQAGRVYVFFGGQVLDTIPDFTYTESGTNNLLGYRKAIILGDIDFDGYDDFCVSSDVYVDPFAGKVGKVHIFRGGPVITEDTTLVGEDDKGNFGWSIAPIDFDGDSRIEIFIGAYYAPYSLKSGKAYLFEALPKPVTLLMPEHQAVVNADSVIFRWRAGHYGVTGYWHELAFDSAFTDTFFGGGPLTDTTIVVTQLTPERTYYWRVRARNVYGWGPFSAIRSFRTVMVDVKEGQGIPGQFNLSQNYPNPFNPSTTIRFTLRERSYVVMKVYDLLGRKVATLLDETMDAGEKSIDFVPRGLSTGVYICQIRAGNSIQAIKMILLK
jgi:hypothetical protein